MLCARKQINLDFGNDTKYGYGILFNNCGYEDENNYQIKFDFYIDNC